MCIVELWSKDGYRGTQDMTLLVQGIFALTVETLEEPSSQGRDARYRVDAKVRQDMPRTHPSWLIGGQWCPKRTVRNGRVYDIDKDSLV